MCAKRPIEARHVSGADERVDVAPGGRRRSEPNVDHFSLDVQNVGADIVCEHLDGRPRESDPHLARDVDLLDSVGPIPHAASLSTAAECQSDLAGFALLQRAGQSRQVVEHRRAQRLLLPLLERQVTAQRTVFGFDIAHLPYELLAAHEQ